MFVTMIWNDCYSDGLSDHHWHTMHISINDHRKLGSDYTVRSIMTSYYEEDDELVDEAMARSYGLVGIFEGIPTTI